MVKRAALDGDTNVFDGLVRGSHVNLDVAHVVAMRANDFDFCC